MSELGAQVEIYVMIGCRCRVTFHSIGGCAVVFREGRFDRVQ